MGQLKHTLMGFASMVAIMLLIFLGVNFNQNGDNDGRQPSSKGLAAGIVTPQGHNYYEKEELWHLSEGADFLPLRWFLNLESTFFKNGLSQKPTMMYEKLGQKFGVVETDGLEHTPSGSGVFISPMKWVGLTLAWSEPVSQIPDANGPFELTNDFKVPSKPKNDQHAYTVLNNIDRTGVRPVSNSRFGGQLEIPMLGTNCAFCHSNSMRFKKKNSRNGIAGTAFVEGAPNLLNVRNFFQDLTGGALKTMVQEESLARYVTRITSGKTKVVELSQVEKSVGIEDLKGNEQERVAALAEKFVLDFKYSLSTMPVLDGNAEWERFKGFARGLRDGIGNILKNKSFTVEKAKAEISKATLLDAILQPGAKPVLAEFMGRFLALSYGVKYETIRGTPSLKGRMEWIAQLLSVDPNLAATTEGYGRTDAFGRISNGVARGDNALPLVAPVSFPPMWSMQFSNLFHFNGNTNSVIMRNIGQSFGLGALVFNAHLGLPADDQNRPLVGSNIYNLNRLEKHLYNIKVPEWNALVPKGLQVDTNDQTRDRWGKTVKDQVQLGCQVYVDNCMGCHDSGDNGDSYARVGPNKTLINHFVEPLRWSQTDPNHNKIQPTPVLAGDKQVPFRQALFQLTKAVKERYMDDMFSDPAEAKKAMEDWGNYVHRGQEHFRDTYLGENFKSDGWLEEIFGILPPNNYRESYELKYMALVDTKTGEPLENKYGYIAKSLAGIWATAPYLHNGSVPNIELLINPKKNRPKRFYVGCRVYDHEKLGYVYSPSDYQDYRCGMNADQLFDADYKLNTAIRINGEEFKHGPYDPNAFDENGAYTGGFTNGNYNGGHNLNAEQLARLAAEDEIKINAPGTISQVIADDEQRAALMTFLKVLRPEAEYDWGSKQPYEIRGTTCVGKAVPLPESGKAY